MDRSAVPALHPVLLYRDLSPVLKLCLGGSWFSLFLCFVNGKSGLQCSFGSTAADSIQAAEGDALLIASDAVIIAS